MSASVAVLLATYNGESFLYDQLLSIQGQSQVDPNVYLSDDCSDDLTLSVAKQASSDLGLPLHINIIPRHSSLLGRSAAHNFYHLITSVCLPKHIEWVSFCDQDDIWVPSHLSRAIRQLLITSSAAYSSNVTAFWPDGRRRLIKKTGFASPLNHLFESPGPGCSIVLPRSTFDQLQTYFRQHITSVSLIDFHDWAIYAYVRTFVGPWLIDNFSSLLYRQHDSNVLGVGSTFEDFRIRCNLLLNGWYRNQLLYIAATFGLNSSVEFRSLSRFLPHDRLLLSVFSFYHRRRLLDKILLSLAFLVMRKSSY